MAATKKLCWIPGGRAMADDIVIVRTAPRIDQEQPIRVRHPVGLCVVAAEVCAVIERPLPRLAEVQPVGAHGEIGRAVVPHREIKPASKLRQE